MMKSIAIISLLTTAVLAQSSSSSASAATSTANPLIPTGISSSCTSFLTALNSNTTMSACTSSLISASSAYGPGGTASSSKAVITSALGKICATNTACPASLLRTKLAEFYTACPAELTSSPNKDVLRTYDVVYALSPFISVVCSKDDSGNYIVTETSSFITNTSTTSTSSASGLSNAIIAGSSSGLTTNQIQNYLYSSLAESSSNARRSEVALVPNTTTYGTTNLPFLFLQPGLASDVLCTSSTRAILTAYISFESDIPYAPGLANSPFLAGQTALYTSVSSICGSTFLSGAVQAAGGLGGGVLSGASRAVGEVKGTTAVILGAVSLVFASLL